MNGTVPPRRRRSTVNTYTKAIPFSQVPAPQKTSRSSASASSRLSTGTTNPSSSPASIQEESSLIVRGILEKTGCSSRQEFLANRAAEEAQQANMNGNSEKSNAPSTATNGSTNTATNCSKSTAKDGSKSTTNRAKAKSTNGANSKVSTNPKKKSKGMYYG